MTSYNSWNNREIVSQWAQIRPVPRSFVRVFVELRLLTEYSLFFFPKWLIHQLGATKTELIEAMEETATAMANRQGTILVNSIAKKLPGPFDLLLVAFF